MKKVKLALYGAIGSGKTSTAQAIQNKFGKDKVEILSFASPLKQLAELMLSRPINKATDRLFVSHVGQGMRSEILKFMGPYHLAEFLIKSINDEMFVDAHQHHYFCKRIQEETFKFCKENPSWGHVNFWVKQLISQVEKSNAEIVVIDDLRFKAEHEALSESGFIFARTLCGDEFREARIIERDGKYNRESEDHPSELEWPNFPHGERIWTYNYESSELLHICDDLDKQIEELIAKIKATSH